MKKLLFIINPRSGKGKIRTRLLEILDIFIKAGYDVEVHVTQKALDAREAVIKKGRRMDLIVCSGGDGTLNETVSGIMELEDTPVLGYIPSGSTNDYGTSLNIPKQIIAAANIAVRGENHMADVGMFCGERYFVYIAGFGAFTEVSYITPQDKKNLLGHQAYVMEAAKRLTALKSSRMKIQWEQEDGSLDEIEGEFIFGMVTNTISVGGFKGLIKGNVVLNDGVFEGLFIHMPKTPLELSNIVSYLLIRDDQENECVKRISSRKITVRSSEPVDWVLDGEFGGTKTDVTIENLRERIEIRTLPAKKTLKKR